MDIDIERLKVDADYWDEVAPEGSTHAIPNRGYSATGVTWFKRLGKCEWKVWSRYVAESFLRWCDSVGTSDGDQFIPRPTKQEWVDGLPPVGIQCEVLHLGRTWRRAGIVAHVMSVEGEKAVWQLVDYSEWGGDLAESFRPIRTKEQRQRDELIEILSGNWLNSDMDQLADAILYKYHLEPKP